MTVTDNQTRPLDLQRSHPLALSRCSHRHILIITGSSCRQIDVAAFHDIFSLTNELLEQPRYVISTLPGSEDLRNDYQSTGRDVEERLANVSRLDTLIVCGENDTVSSPYDVWSMTHLRNWSKKTRRIVGVGEGAIMLARAGLLAGKKAATHWNTPQRVQDSFPSISFQAQTLYIRDERLYTCAGGTGSIDLALELVEEDFGVRLASAVAERLLIPYRRYGGNRQISSALEAQTRTSSALVKLLAWMPDHISEDLGVPKLARRAAMSPRNFARVFKQQTGTTPARYVQSLRLEAAQRALADKTQSLSQTAVRSGLGTPDSLRRLFLREFGMTAGSFRAGMS